MKKIFLFSFAFITLFSCSEKKREINYNSFIEKGDSISSQSQSALVNKVSAAIQKGGTEYAVDFCNLNAMPLTDSLSENFGVSIQRISNKTRNNSNLPKSENDKAVLDLYQINFENSANLNDTVIDEKDKIVYYKPIYLALPACIKCHGTPGEDINEPTLKLIQEKYPDDLAINYKDGGFRGAWKITFSE